MKQNVLLAVLAAAAAALTVVVVRQRSEIADLKQTAQVVAAKSALPTEQPAPAARAEEPEAPASATPDASASAPAAASNTNGTRNVMSGLAGMMKNPQMKEMVRVQQKVMLDRTYGSLLKYLSTRPQSDTDALKQLLEDRQMALVDAGMAMMGGSAEERKKAIDVSKTVKAEYDKKIEDLLGAQDYEVFKQYEATNNERMQVRMFKDALPATAALTDQQESDMILAMAEERKTLPASSLLKNGQNSDPTQLTEENIADALKQLEQLQKRYADRAAAILTPAQLEQFTAFQKQWSTMQVAGLKMAVQMFGNKAAAPPATVQTPPP